MTVIASLSVTPVPKESMAEDVATAVEELDGFDVSYETNAMGTVIEADDIDELFAAVKAAHRAVDAERVATVLQIDDERTTDEQADEQVTSVEEELGREATDDSA
ncbi:MTH1187 family thiamine-binding protein [Haladaptatus salinisoli]|uniref:MTH1187 family thiamine-binding protein n=1 Tax=Haladaptatus salinisoli TaxID=2884876 RepID=UPI001D0B0DCE|nr:MTH1187 family thiamine-binding protein [Haladaptatus salinisoli]